MVLKKSQTSQVWKVNFMSKEKTLYLCLNDYIFKLYRFLVKVNFNLIDKLFYIRLCSFYHVYVELFVR